MSNIVLKNVCKSYDKEHYAVQDFSLEIPDREFVIFVGPSGCGKSTTLRMIAGLEEITSGELWIDGQLCNYVEAKDRDLSMVFQNYALYPNMMKTRITWPVFLLMKTSISSNFQKTSTMDDTDTWTGFTMCLTKVNSDPKQVTLSRSEPVQPASP